VEYRILGPLEVSDGAALLSLGGTRQQIVLATLLLSANRVVSMDRLVAAIYGESAPATARSQVQIAISGLRRIFSEVGDFSGVGDRVIATHPHGYIMRIETPQLDSLRFAELVAAARASRDAGQPDQAVASYREALRLWRGPALAGLDADIIRLAATHLDEQRSLSNEDRISLELKLGRHHEMVGELTELIEEHPFRERIRGQLMLALYRCGRTADALATYRDARRIMIDELGLEPDETLRQLERDILASSPVLDLASGTQGPPPVAQLTVPRLLPPDIANFTGREKQVEEISQRLAPTDGAVQLAVPIVWMSGKGGIGKSTIAVHAAHAIAPSFPDGQLFADLHRATGPVPPAKVLERFLRTLGMPGSQIPETLEERAEAYRALLSGRNVLVVLDDAASEGQVVPLIPGSPSSAVIVTSRTRLAGLSGAAHIDVDVFDADKSVELLASIAGPERVAAQPAAALEIAELCGYLPLAIRIAGARLSALQHWTIQHLADRLAVETRRLDELKYGDMAIRANISISYEGVSEQARRLLRLLGMLDMPSFAEWMPAALLDASPFDAQDYLDELVTAQLIEAAGAHRGQYRFHALIRLFAVEHLAAEEPPAARSAALQRVISALVNLAEEAQRRSGDYVPAVKVADCWTLPDQLVLRLIREPMAWFEAERATLMSVVRQAAEAGLSGLCWRLALSAVTLYEAKSYLDDWRETHEIALEAARKAKDVLGQAMMIYSTGALHLVEHRFERARQDFAAAATIFTEIADERGIALVTRHFGFLDRMNGQLADAARHYERALSIFRASADHVTTAHVLHGLACVHLERGQLDKAGELLTEALGLAQQAGSSRVEAQMQHRMGEANLRAGENDLASDRLVRALARVQDDGDLLGEAHVLRDLGVARARQGEHASAHAALERAVMLAHALGDRIVEARALLGMSELALARDDPGQAVTLAERARDMFRDAGTPQYEAQALTLLSNASHAR
jgi:DNA-binding SARP family transcriptional activator